MSTSGLSLALRPAKCQNSRRISLGILATLGLGANLCEMVSKAPLRLEVFRIRQRRSYALQRIIWAAQGY